jgi:CBS-domain-containing membrane protein
MKIADIMTREVRTCELGTSLTQVARLMRAGCCGAIPVIDADGNIAGVVTDRDISMAIVNSSRRPINIEAREIMSPHVHYCAPDDDVRSALQTMKLARVRRLPVIGPGGRLAGIVSMDDVILRALAPDAPDSTEIVDSLREIVLHQEKKEIIDPPASGSPGG